MSSRSGQDPDSGLSNATKERMKRSKKRGDGGRVA